ncbi:hypothetical protein G6F70_000492 [Rhizopus microsporus]|nr:hypothetical protein G6F71_000336 [Rhizopus microsporus]KAG1204454.1 hypothetical protein G6F70_000492 [Rhizopus microsporus]KAG1215862.1 hypothetical protein G6F69_000588 [Rhizopus microsporus]KAG1238530.1 hypothetical protein G6F67_000325 [Rhizopus microsporus]KAG1265662.1 hypothetical protein G6F68_003384 [Rhizopus microsporus]
METDTLNEETINWESVEARKDIYDSIKNGDIEQALTLLEKHFPGLIAEYNRFTHRPQIDTNDASKSHFIIYKLYCQQFIETLKSSGALEAIEFARHYLKPCHEIYKEYANNILYLIAYADLEHERVKDVLSQKHRDDIADEVNELLLEIHGLSQQTSLEKIWRQNTVVQTELEKRQHGQSKKKNSKGNSEKVSV